MMTTMEIVAIAVRVVEVVTVGTTAAAMTAEVGDMSGDMRHREILAMTAGMIAGVDAMSDATAMSAGMIARIAGIGLPRRTMDAAKEEWSKR
jgi:hypothetical protein